MVWKKGGYPGCISSLRLAHCSHHFHLSTECNSSHFLFSSYPRAQRGQSATWGFCLVSGLVNGFSEFVGEVDGSGEQQNEGGNEALGEELALGERNKS